MNFKSYLLRFFSFTIFAMMISCDKDFNEIGTNIVGGDNDHYLFDRYENASIKAYNQKIGAVAMNNLPINPLGIYKNPVFGTTTAGFVSQLEMASGSIGRKFNNTDSTLYQDLPIIDSVILNVPYYSKVIGTVTSEGISTYQLDSIYGEAGSKMRLSVYESNYFLRDLDPTAQFTEQQVFYNDMQEIENQKIPFVLNNLSVFDDKNLDGHENAQFYFDKREHKTTVKNSENVDVPTRSVPSLRLHLDKATFYNKIINAPTSQLASNTIFKNYFRGLYFKVEDLGNSNSMAMLNFANANAKVTVYYTEDLKVTIGSTTTFEKKNKTFDLNFAGNRVSLQSNSNENMDYLSAANATQEASKLYLKGGEGSIAIIDLFGPDADNNGIADEVEQIKANGWLINEANLTFYIDKTAITGQAIEPNRLMLYDLNNNRVLLDYLTDQSLNSRNPKQNKFIHGGILLDEDDVFVKQIKDETTGLITNRGTKYKIRLTNHIKNLINKDSTNVRLGLVVTESINTIGFSKLKTPIGNIKKVPQMSALSPVGTILYGTNIPVGDPNYANRLKLEIYYTKPD
ncbi:MAG TPA: DUF4270 domain-containing protein [Flavobacterium sp.]|jgi:hypothetical protein|nr:DUF4270 domain-containing protein [Flavobacterium sp.]